ncbi:MAG: hypothetical protein ACI92S_002152, partial [Planctomycetaceae bacterium]
EQRLASPNGDLVSALTLSQIRLPIIGQLRKRSTQKLSPTQNGTPTFD